MTDYHDPYSPSAAAQLGSREPGEPAPGTAADVPVGTSQEVLAWVGTDLERVSAALEVEKAHARPRTGLIGDLEELLA